MKVMRKRAHRTGFNSSRGTGGLNSDLSSPSYSWLFYAAESIYFIFLVLPEYFGMNIPLGLLIAIRAAITLTAIPAMWLLENEDILKPTRILLTIEAVLLWLDLIPGCLRISVVLHLIVFIALIADLFISGRAASIGKSELVSYMTLLLRLGTFAVIKITSDDGNYFVWALAAGVLCGTISAFALARSHVIHPILCVLCSLPIALISSLLIQGTVALLNYGLAGSEPVNHTVSIEEIDHNHRGPDAFIVSIHGKPLSITVSTFQRMSFNKGDTINISEHNGAFGIKYYMIDE